MAGAFCAAAQPRAARTGAAACMRRVVRADAGRIFALAALVLFGTAAVVHAETLVPADTSLAAQQEAQQAIPLDSLSPEAQQTIWDVAAPRGEGLFEGHAPDEVRPALAPLSRSEQLVLDYERTGVSVADHPMLLLRPRLPASVKGSRDVLRMKSGARVTVAGLVICRQRPMTASGVVFATLEDEHGFINLVLWARVFEQHRHVATTASLLLVKGKLDRSGAVVHVVVDTLERLDPASVERTPRGRHPRDEVQAGAPYLRGFSRDFR